MKVLVTGGAGFIGFHVAKALLQRADQVVIVDNFNDYYDPKLKEARIEELKKYGNFDLYRIDISNYDDLKKVFQENKFDKICNLAAQAGVRYSIDNPFTYEKSNNLGMLNVLELMKEFSVKDIVFASSSSVYGNNTKVPFSETDNVDNPISLYAATKKNNELMAYTYHHLYGFNCTGLRFFTVYGPWGRPDMAYFKFTKKILNNETINVYNNGNLKRDFTFISDIVFGVLSALDNPFTYEIINLGNNNPIELLNFIEIIENNLGKKSNKNMVVAQKGDVNITYANIKKANKLLDYNPKVKLDEGIKLFIDWYSFFVFKKI